MRKWAIACVTGILLATGEVGMSSAAQVQAKDLGIVSGRGTTVEFRVSNVQMKRVDGARVLIIDDRGKLIQSGLTNREGVYDARIATPLDRRFVPVKKMGTVTAILFADGYNESIVFDVPVQSGQVQPVMLNPIVQNQRNEPTIMLGNIHRHTYIGLVSYYAELQKLKKQPPIPGEQNYAPWSSRTQ
ncbi:MAG: hypothetical protein OWR52_12790 [Acidibacillus sp.]|nr:hypothetical protein [Acidibacillus sp.]